MNKHAPLLLVLAGLVLGMGCTCADTAAQQRFACTTSADCADGYGCDSSGECVPLDAGPGGGAGGGAAGGSGGGAAGGSGGGGGGDGGLGGGGGVDAGGPQLVFTSAPQTVAVGSCSAPVTFEVREGQAPIAVAVATAVSIAAAPSGVLGLFAGPGCTDAGAVLLAPDAGSGSFSFFAGDGGGFSLSLSAPGLAGASQQATTTFPPAASLVFVTAPQTVRAGDCSAALTLELRDASNAPARANGPLAVSLSATPAAPGMLFFSDSACLLAISQATVPFGASRTTFYAARDTGTAYLINAISGALSATLSHVVLPVVRTGTCLISAGDGGTSCPVVPPVLSLTDSFLVYQVATATDIAGAAAVLCELDGLANISCQRGRTDQDAVIRWQLAEVKGATVRKVSTFCDGGLSVPLGAAAPLGSSFVLTANQNDGQTIDDSDFNIGRLNDAGTAVDFDFGSVCSGTQSMLAQVVTLPNIVVKRGTTSLLAGAATRSINDPPPPAAGVLLAQWSLAINGPGVCDRTLRPELPGNAVAFSRGNNSANAFCTASSIASVFFEKVDFRSTALVQQVQLTMGTGTNTSSAVLTAVDRTRTLVFTGAQGSTGQSLGEGTHPGTTNTTDVFGEISVTLGLGGTAFQSTQLDARRSSSLGASRWTAWVVELIP